MRLSYQHGYGRIVFDEYFVLYDAYTEEIGLEEVLLAKSRGVLGVTKTATGTYHITFKRAFPRVPLYAAGRVYDYYSAGLVFCETEDDSQYTDQQFVATPEWVPLSTDHSKTKELIIHVVHQYSVSVPINGTRNCLSQEAANAQYPVYVGICRPLHCDLARHLEYQGGEEEMMKKISAKVAARITAAAAAKASPTLAAKASPTSSTVSVSDKAVTTPVSDPIVEKKKTKK